MQSRLVGGKMLRRGYTTGSCAAAAAKAAVIMLLSQNDCKVVNLTTPSGIVLTFDVADTEFSQNLSSCAVQKDSGDDPDVTNGCFVYAHVSFADDGIEIVGGQGVGRVTKPGLDQLVGVHAINTVPRRMIHEACKSVCEAYNYSKGLLVTISIPDGEELAKRTFNPRMGIVGGLSILGTTGIVEPMSEKAVVDTFKAELSLLFEAGHRDVTLTIGNYGDTFARNMLGLTLESHVKCSNFIGDTLSAAAEKGFISALLIGHIGKLIKLGIGIMNTHSSHGDGRMETLITCALEAGASLTLLNNLRECISTDAALIYLREAGLLETTLPILKNRISDTIRRHIAESLNVSIICFEGIGCEMKELFRI